MRELRGTDGSKAYYLVQKRTEKGIAVVTLYGETGELLMLRTSVKYFSQHTPNRSKEDKFKMMYIYYRGNTYYDVEQLKKFQEIWKI